MSQKEFMHLKDILLAGRGEILDRVRNVSASLVALSEPVVEMEEGAQKAALSEALDRLGENGKLKIELIDLALRKMSVGEYGTCEACGDDIAPKRLEAVPWTRLCLDCAREYERKRKELPLPSEAFESARIPEEYESLSGQQLLRAIYDHVDKHIDVDTLSIKVSVRNGAVYVEGSVSEVEHQVILQVLSDDMGFSEVVDLLEIGDEPGDGEGNLLGSGGPALNFEGRLM